MRTRTKEGIVIIAPAWHSCGSYAVFRSQVEIASSLDKASYFLAISPSFGITKRSRTFWSNYHSLTSDIAADERGHTARAFFPIASAAFWNNLANWRRSFAYWRTLPAALADLPHSLMQFIEKHPTHTILCNHYFTLPIAACIRDRCLGSSIVLETHDLQANHFVDQARKHPLTRRLQTFQELLEDEIEMVERADTLVHLNEDEAKIFAEFVPNRQHVTIFPSFPDNYCEVAENAHPEKFFDFLIVAAANPANYQSVAWFLDRVWSEELSEKYALRIVGNIDELFRARSDRLYQKYRKCFEGRVDTTGRFYRSAGTVLLPTIAGHGISMKTIEALSFGKPFIATPPAFRGFERHVSEDLRRELVTSPEAFRERLVTAAGRDPSAPDPRCIALFDRLFSKEMRSSRYIKLLKEIH